MLSLEVKTDIDPNKWLKALNSSIDVLKPGIDALAKAIKNDAPNAGLKNAIKHFTVKTATGVKGIVKGPWYWHFFEYGTRGHIVQTKKAKVLSGNNGVWGTNAYIPAIQKSSYIRKNVDEKKDDLLKLVIAKMNQMWGR